jgi:drug/metabolite transporter (DMT)-like permease
MIDPKIATVYSEIVLSLYPVLLKTVNTNIFTQVLSRFIVFPLLAFYFGQSKDYQSIINNPTNIIVSFFHNLLNLGHIVISYIAFKDLPIGTSMSLFYLYPIFNVIMAAVLLKESLRPLSLVLILVAFVGVYLIATSKRESTSDGKKLEKTDRKYKFSVLMAILAAVTETMIFLFIRTNGAAIASPFYTVNHLYPMGLVLMGLYAASHTKLIDMSGKNWLILILFNALLGFTGYVARFYSIPKIPTILFASLSFLGVCFGHLWDVVFTNEVVSNNVIIGGLLIAGSAGVLRFFEV